MVPARRIGRWALDDKRSHKSFKSSVAHNGILNSGKL